MGSLSEVESMLQEHADVRAAVCVQQPDASQQVIAYVVADGIGPTPAQLRRRLEGRVSPELLPSVFVLLDALPLTPDGSVDHAALPPPNPVWAAIEQQRPAYVAPRNATETTLAEIMQEVLLVDTVGIHDDFIELGGDSLLATQTVALIYQRLNKEILLDSLFERGTIAELVEDYFSGAAAAQASGTA